MPSREEACKAKVRYASEQECYDAIKQRRAPVLLHPYQCDVCGGWHKTKRRLVKIYRKGKMI